MAGTVLIVDDEIQLVRHLEHLLRTEGYQPIGVHDGKSARKAVAAYFPDVVLIDLKLPDVDGTALLTELADKHPSAGYIIITAFGSIKSAVEATRKGAREYLTKPFEPDELLLAVRNVMHDRLRDEEIKLLRKTGPVFSRRPQKFDVAIEDYTSEAMQAVMVQTRYAAQTDSIVLLLGESGSGKDFIARHIHNRSKRCNGPFFAINCAAVAPELAESELFGHEPGAFTGARGRKRGLLELAEGGTLLLNEIGELSTPMQAKLLTFLDTRTFTRVGGETQIPVNARLIAATNKELEKEVDQGRFRKDLYYRLNVITVRVPPLRQRMEDLPLLVQEILGQLSDEMGLQRPIEADDRSIRTLSGYHWPGNIRELRNALERGIMLSDSDRINLSSLGAAGDQENWTYMVNFPQTKSIHDITRDLKRALILEALRRSRGNKQEAARSLGVSRHAFAHQMKASGLDEDQ
jgi:DNA-binding NtrC family response regulator